MSWLFSQALVEEYLGENFSDGEPSALLSGKPIPQAYCAPGKMTVFSRLSRFGMTFKPLTESRGEELLTLYLAGFHAKTSPQRGGGLALTESAAECGEKWRGSFTKYDPDTSLWRTHQCSLLGDLEPFLETWPKWGLMRDGECWEQITLAHHIKEKEYGLKQYVTPTTRDYKGMSGAGFRARHGENHNLADCLGGTPNPTWVEWLMGWPLGWTDLKPLETDKSLFAPQQHGDY
jgi:hypothetical protein